MSTNEINAETLASQRYLEPERNLGNAILSVSVNAKQDHFIVEIFEEEERETIVPGTNTVIKQLHKITPRSHGACTFVSRRFKHGYRQVSRQGCYHPIYQVPITDYSLALINKAWTNPKRISEVAKPIMNRVFLREFMAESNAKRTAQYKNNAVVPTNDWFDAHDAKLASMGIKLNPYQKTAAYNACMSKAYALFCDPGTGKTAMMLTKLDYVIEHHHVERPVITLVLCPKSISGNWKREIAKFCVNSDKIATIIIRGNSPTDRVVNFMNDAALPDNIGKHIVLISGYESFIQTEKLHKLEYDLLLLDESHSCANPSTKRTKTLMELRKKFANVVIATGTPFRNSPFDIYSQFEILGEGFSGFESFAAFKTFYGVFSQNYQGGRTVCEGFRNIPLLQEKMAKYSFIIRKEEALPHLPKKTFSLLECNLTKDQYKVYLALVSQLTAEIESYHGEIDSMTVNNILTKMLRLAQVTSGFAVGDLNGITRFNPNPKLNLLVKYLKGSDDDDIVGVLEDPTKKALVWCAFKENLSCLSERLTAEGIKNVTFHGNTEDKDAVVDQFNCDRDTKVFIGIAASGGVGLNLVGFDPLNADAYDTNTSDVIIYSSNWSTVNRLQAIDRSHRVITRVPQHIVDFLVPNSIDYEIYDRVQSKVQMGLNIQNIKDILTKMLPAVNGD